MKAPLLVLVFVGLLAPSFTYGCPGPRPSFTLGTTHFASTKSAPQVGDSAVLRFSFTAQYTGIAHLQLAFPGAIVPFDQSPGERSRDSLIWVDSGAVYSDSTVFKLSSFGSSMVSYSIIADSALCSHLGMGNGITDYVDVDHSPTAFNVYYSTTHIATNDTLVCDNMPQGTATLNISGRVQYNDVDRNKECGLDGAIVVIAFVRRHTDGQVDNGSFAHPFAGFQNGFHWTSADVNGNFGFSFTGPTDWSAYSKVLLFVMKSNDAVSSLVSASAVTIWIDDVVAATVFPSAEGAEIPITDNHTIVATGVTIEINRIDGAILQYMELSHAFEHARGIKQPDPIPVYNEGLPGNDAGLFVPHYVFLAPNTFEIDIDPVKGSPFFATIAHEYGHYQNCINMNQSLANWQFSTTDFKEGWAEFHQFAVRNWAYDMYGIDSPWWDDNQEEAPFKTPRWAGIRYQSSAATSGFSCFLWNIYDSYRDDGFKAPVYDISNNDDVGIGKKVSDAISDVTGAMSIDAYRNSVESYTLSELSSIESIYNCMMGNGATLMRAAQVTNLTGWVDEMPSPGGGYHLHLSWDRQDYPSSSPFANLASATNVYQSNGSGGWNFLASVSGSATSYSTDAFDNNGTMTFKVTSANSSGESQYPPVLAAEIVGKIAVGNEVTAEPFGMISVYPNPAHDRLFVNAGSRDVVAYQVIDLLGRERLQGKLSETGGSIIDIHALHSGVFILRLSASGRSVSRVIVRN